jgi:hypothetical protein
MTLWITTLYVLSNFSLGAMLPLLPALSPDSAGWSFTAFQLMKVLFFVPAGLLGDRIGHARALTLTLGLQVAALVLVAAWPERPWIGRILEGMALAQGTVTLVSLLRIVSPGQADFGATMRKVLGIGSLGFLLGPVVGYPIAARRPGALVLLLVALNAAAFVLQIALMQRRAERYGRGSGTVEPRRGSSAAIFVWAVVGLAAVKAVAVGWQPNLAWWNTHEMGFSSGGAALTFLVTGVAYGLGASMAARTPTLIVTTSGLVGFGLLELALRSVPVVWWPAVFLLGFWFGGYLTRAIVLLGWNDPDALGRKNAVWLALTDLPMALTPAIVWNWRAPSPGTLRLASGMGLVVISILGMLLVPRQRARR